MGLREVGMMMRRCALAAAQLTRPPTPLEEFRSVFIANCQATTLHYYY